MLHIEVKPLTSNVRISRKKNRPKSKSKKVYTKSLSYSWYAARCESYIKYVPL